ncbi:MAG TPA: RDD family protein [Phycisphaerae bacterium]|nr:RDD family protein [Phycisphaerae bacterium]
MRQWIVLLGLTAGTVLAGAGCAPSEAPGPAAAAPLIATGNFDNLYAVLVDGSRSQFRYRQRDAEGSWRDEVGVGRGLPAAAVAWREDLVIFFPSGRYGLFRLGERPAVRAAPVAAWEPIAACEDGAAMDVFGWNKAGDLIHARFEEGEWAWDRVPVTLERDSVRDPCAVRFKGRVFLAWRAEETLIGASPRFRLRFLYRKEGRWFPLRSRLSVASAPGVAATAEKMVCLYRKPSAEDTPGPWAVAVYATADEDWHEAGELVGQVPEGPVALARQGEHFYLMVAHERNPEFAPLDVKTQQVGEFEPVAGTEAGRGPTGRVWNLWLTVALFAGVLLFLGWRARARQRRAPAQNQQGAAGPAAAPLGRRAAAVFVDYIVLSFILVPVIFYVAPDLPERFVRGETVPFAKRLVLELIRLGLTVAYFSLAEGVTGRTLGKALLGLEVRSESGASLTRGQALLRNLGRIVDEMPGLYVFGMISILLGPRAQRIGDRMARTLVVRREAPDHPAL